MEGSAGFTPAGWYSDPYAPAQLRWWDGVAWSAYTSPRPDALAPWNTPDKRPSKIGLFLRSLPRAQWLGCAAVVGIIGLITFGQAESTSTPDPATWYLAGFVAAALVAFGGSIWTLGRRRWREVAVFAALVASVLAFAVTVTAAPSTSRSCNNNDQPRSAGTYECDTGFGLGLPFVIAVFFVPAFGLASAGKAAAIVGHRASRR